MTKFIEVYSGDTQQMVQKAISNKKYAEMQRWKARHRRGPSDEKKFTRRAQSKLWLGRSAAERLVMRRSDYRDEWHVYYFSAGALERCQ